MLAFALIVAGAASRLCKAQPPEPSFDVASVKPSLEQVPGSSVRLTPGGRLVAQNATLQLLITTAYQIRDFQIAGGPAWLNSDHYDIEAKVQGNPDPDQISEMLQALLRDRFHLVVHREKRELRVYRLTVAKGGVKLQPAREGNCTPMIPPPAHVNAAVFRPCGGFNSARNFLMGGAVPLARLCTALSRIVGMTVVDQTGVESTFDITLRWTPDEAQTSVRPENASTATFSDAAEPSFFTAIQEQLGLRLESGRGPVEVLVIDGAEKASGNWQAFLLSPSPEQCGFLRYDSGQ